MPFSLQQYSDNAKIASNTGCKNIMYLPGLNISTCSTFADFRTSHLYCLVQSACEQGAKFLLEIHGVVPMMMIV